ncbi:retrotransposon-like family member retr-1 [Paramuricea clavata]|uniref:Retrotransposon-like family member retr-1 n=1 Tax=Paramuricea clavata TaxID=317549 RepID=A0A6S7G0A9_PARCT|nr:retrotransposon-like family member retr-1 [Paramuricea clavata]
MAKKPPANLKEERENTTSRVDPTVTLVINPSRTIPAALRSRVKEELDDMERKNVICKVEEPTDWVSSMVVVEKPNGKLHICLDPKHLNKAIKREHFQLPTIEDITTRMANAKWFSKLDANHGYWQIPLDEESQLLTTFNTPFGRYCYTCTPFEEHDRRLESVLERCEKINLTLNKEKCEFKSREITYVGHKLTENGVKPDEVKVKAINEMEAPTDKKGVEKLLGTVNYLGKFIPNLATIAKPIRSLLKKEIEFQWSFKQQKAFQDIKDTLTKDEGPVLKFFDVSKPVTISCDASPTGLGAVLLQDGYPVAYTSRSLTETESRYAQIEKELLAVQFSLDRFHQYVYGKEVIVESDHKPLEMIAKKSLALAPPRLQRLLLRIQKYNYTIVYKSAKEMALPDMLSRAPLPETDEEVEKEINLHVHLVSSTLPASEFKLQEIREATKSDEKLRTLLNIIQNGWSDQRESVPLSVLPYWNIRDELSVIDGIILKGDHIVVPLAMRKEMLQRIYHGHMGIKKLKRRARDALYLPLMSKQIAEMVSKCTVCLEHRKENIKEPMIPFRVPTIPWEVVPTDLFSFNNSDYLLIVDYLSRYFEVVTLPDTKSSTVITYSKSIFSRHGIPAEVVSDNGPQYSSREFQAFTESWEFKHTTVSPLNSQANGLAERTVQTIKDILVKSKKDQQDPYLSLLEYRNSPIDDVGSPAQLLMNGRLCSRIPQTILQLKPRVLDPVDVKKKLNLKQQKQKFYYDRQSKSLT